MGRLFLEHPNSFRVYCCSNCGVALTNRESLVSTRFTGSTGRAFLFKKVVNVTHSDVEPRTMITGQHFVRDVSCRGCATKLGWFYEMAKDEMQKYKEGHTILERAMIVEMQGVETASPSAQEPSVDSPGSI